MRLCVTAIGFGTLAVVYPILCIADGQLGLDAIVVTGYYGFFCLFFLYFNLNVFVFGFFIFFRIFPHFLLLNSYNITGIIDNSENFVII